MWEWSWSDTLLWKDGKCYSICTYAGETEVNFDPCWFQQYVEGRPLALSGFKPERISIDLYGRFIENL